MYCYFPTLIKKIKPIVYSAHFLDSKMAIKIKSVVKQLMYVSKLFRATAGSIHCFRICSKETPRIMYPKYPVLGMIQRIHLRCGSFGSILCFRIKIPDLDFSNESHL